MNITCVIVAYNGENVIKKTLAAALPLLNTCIIIDNASVDKTRNVIDSFVLQDKNKIKYILNNKNMGIAYALNQGLQTAYRLGFDWLITLDQDTELPCDYIRNFEIILNKQHYAYSSYAPIVKDSRNGNIIFPNRKRKFIPWCITSGNIISVNEIRKLGGFNNTFFIDSVDFELCLRLAKNNSKIVLMENSTIEHSIGNIKTVTLPGFRVSYIYHSNMRKYYIARNTILLSKRYYFDFPVFFLKKFIILARDIFFSILFEKGRARIIHSYIKGFYDGLSCRYKFNGIDQIDKDF